MNDIFALKTFIQLTMCLMILFILVSTSIVEGRNGHIMQQIQLTIGCDKILYLQLYFIELS